MIYTLTLNPALDYVIRSPKIQQGLTNRVYDESIHVGGKGINVSQVLKILDVNSCCLGFIAGFTGDYITEYLDSIDCHHNFIKVSSGFTRINVKLKEVTQETEMNGSGPKISSEEISMLFNQIDNIEPGDYLFLSGSIPSTVPDNIYEKIMEKLIDKNIKVIVDTSGDPLNSILRYKPFLIKPNKYELEEFFNTSIHNDDDLLYYANKLQQKGAQHVIISLGGDGAFYLSPSGISHRIHSLNGILINSVGAGDSMVAGFISAKINDSSDLDCFKLAVACGSATAFSDGLASIGMIKNMLEQLDLGGKNENN